MTRAKAHIDLALVIPLEEELKEVLEVFGFERDLTVDEFLITEITSPAEGIRVCLIKQDQMGQASSRAATQHLLDNFTVGVLCSFGIAGGLSKDLNLGDICVSQTLYDLTHKGKVLDTQNGIDLNFSPSSYAVDRSLCTRLSHLTVNPALRDLNASWLSACSAHYRELMASHSKVDFSSIATLGETPRVHFGPIASYLVSGSDKLTRKIIAVDRKMLAIETEAGGLFDTAQTSDSTVAVALRGISDFADASKSDLEDLSNNLVRKIAARNAALYWHAQLQSDIVLDYLRKLRRIPATHPTPELEADKLLSESENDIAEHLRELCPAYRARSKGYVLPPPRIAAYHADGLSDDSSSFQNQEIRSVIDNCQRVTISIESTYADRALPWVIGDHLLRTNGDNCVIPVVVDGSQASSTNLQLPNDEEFTRHGMIPVFILANPNISTRNRRNRLIEEASRHPKAKFVIVMESRESSVSTAEFCTAFSSKQYYVRDFSLVTLSDFVSRNFDLGPDEASVVAIRLNELFDRFGMHAHPSYFAGISHDLLSALLEANTRGELVNLAVEGALMLAVAADKSDVSVSKTFRRQFLARLIALQELGSASVDEAKTIEIARAVADEFDIELDAIAFIGAFVEIGLLRFSGGRSWFPFSYVRDYLLAEHLTRNPDEAREYFDFENHEPDLNVFDLYVEINPDVRIVEKLTNLLQQDIELLSEKKKDTVGFLIDDRARPNMLANVASAKARTQRVRRAIQYVLSNPGDLETKQKIIDFSTTLTERVAKEARLIDGEKSSREDGTRSRLGADGIPRRRISLRWHAGCILIGSGAERLRSQPKRHLASLVIRLGNRIADAWTAEISALDFKKIKDEILATSDFSAVAEKIGEKDWNELSKVFSRMIDACEYSFMSFPYRSILAGVCSAGQRNILRRPVKECSTEDLFDEVTRAVWVCDLDPGSAKKSAKQVLGRLGSARLLRYLLAEHLTSRVYWDKWKPAERQNMLELAGDVIPEGVTIDKGKLMRTIESTGKK